MTKSLFFIDNDKSNDYDGENHQQKRKERV